jgi:glycosyltransferase involved in cell wall biosynthesis
MRSSPPSQPADVVVVVPCYEEAARLDVAAYDRFLAAGDLVRLLFVDDGSRDKTATILAGLCGRHEARAALITLDGNRGKAEAVRAGVNHALAAYRPAVVGYWDADLSTPLESIASFLAVLRDRPDEGMVFGSRVKMLGRQVDRQAMRHYVGRVFATAVSLALGLAIYDSQCGAKLFRVTPALCEAFAPPFASRWAFDVEILARLIRSEATGAAGIAAAVYEYPLERWSDVPGSKVRPRDFLRAMIDVARIRFTYLRR